MVDKIRLDLPTLNTLSSALRWIDECDMQIHTMKLPPEFDDVIRAVDVEKAENQLFEHHMMQRVEYGIPGTFQYVWDLISMLELYRSLIIDRQSR
jgi:hypothetical protein